MGAFRRVFRQAGVAARVAILVLLLPAPAGVVAATPDVVVELRLANKHPISPYIYGFNRFNSVPEPLRAATLERAGGNRWTAYNWETNASNAGNDYQFQNDGFFGGGPPGEAVRRFIEADQKAGIASLITVQLQGLVAADTAGPVKTGSTVDAGRFKEVVYDKRSLSADPFTLNPPSNDAYVYMDEFLWAIDKKFSERRIFSSAPKGPPVFVSLDNEPELWNSTHKEIQPAPISADAYIRKSLRLAAALKATLPDVVLFGPAHFGFYGLYNWSGGLTATPDGHDWFVDKYARAIESASARTGASLIDVYDLHWYPEATDSGGHRITQLNGPTLSPDQVQAIVQSPRSYWDPHYVEASWVAKSLGGPINLLGRLQSKLAVDNPRMKLAITEYNHGGGQHVAGAIAEADALGVFGAKNLFAACLWPLTGNEPFVLGGLRAFRNFDGNGANFGDLSVETVSSNVESVSAYASLDSATSGRLVVVLINRTTMARSTRLSGIGSPASVRLFQVTSASLTPQGTVVPQPLESRASVATPMDISLAPLSVTTVEIRLK